MTSCSTSMVMNTHDMWAETLLPRPPCGDMHATTGSPSLARWAPVVSRPGNRAPLPASTLTLGQPTTPWPLTATTAIDLVGLHTRRPRLPIRRPWHQC